LIERDRPTLRRTASKNHRITAAQVNCILFPQKLSDVSFTNPTSTVGLQLLNLSLLKAMLRCVNDIGTTITPGYQTNGNARVIWSDESPFTLFPTSGRVYVWRPSKEINTPECLVRFQ
jgi:hypothetical protein